MAERMSISIKVSQSECSKCVIFIDFLLVCLNITLKIHEGKFGLDSKLARHSVTLPLLIFLFIYVAFFLYIIPNTYSVRIKFILLENRFTIVFYSNQFETGRLRIPQLSRLSKSFPVYKKVLTAEHFPGFRGCIRSR